ncbi:unnamed protein product, partial [Polarella glacialis]
VMEQGEMDLGRLLQSEPDLSLGDLQALWRQMLEAVQVIHNERIVHSDLKPGNFLLVGKRLKLIDFGIAKKIASNTTNISRETSVGTISYMAPEAVRQGALKIGRPSDIWSLGIILYQMVYMRSPFAHLDPMQRLFALTDPNMCVEFPTEHRLDGHASETKEFLLDTLHRCLQRDPRKRPEIPQLLAHPFLSSDTIRLTRGAFDRAMEALVAGFYGAAQGALGMDVEGSQDNGDELQPGLQDCVQILSDEVWQRVSRVEQGQYQVQDSEQAEFSGLAHFKQWVARGALKRQRTAAPACEVAESWASAYTRVPASSSTSPPAPQPPPAPAPATSSAKPAVSAQRPVASMSWNAQVAAAGGNAGARTASAGKRSPRGTEAAPTRTPLASIGNGNAKLAEKSAAAKPEIYAELLQNQKSCLRKAGPVGGKENAVPGVRAAPPGNSGG